MTSNQLPVRHFLSKQASKGYTCTEKYEWQNLTLRQREQMTREKHLVATPNCRLHISRRVEESGSDDEVSHLCRGCYSFPRTGGETLNSRCSSFLVRDIKRAGAYATSYDHGHSSEIHVPENGINGPDHPCCSRSTKRTKHNISPRPSPIRSNRRQMHQEVNFRKDFRVNKGSSSRNRHVVTKTDTCPPMVTCLPCGHFAEIDAARHRSYMRSFHSYEKQMEDSCKDPIINISDDTLSESSERDGIVIAHPKRPVDELHAIRHEQLELSDNENFHDHLGNCRNFKNACSVDMPKVKKGSFRKSTYAGDCFSKYGRNSSQTRNIPDSLSGQKALNSAAYENKSEILHHPNEQDQHLQVESKKIQNDSWERNVKTTKLAGQTVANGSCNPKKHAPTASAWSDSTKCEHSNVSSPKNSSKTNASSNRPKLSEGKNNIGFESDKQSMADGCTKRGILQHLPVTNMDKSSNLKESHNLSHSKVRRDCLNLWRTIRLRKDSVAVADKTVIVGRQQSAQTSKVSIGRRGHNRRHTDCASSESDDEYDSGSESSDQFSSAMSSEGLKMHGEERANKKLEWTSSCSSSRNGNKNPQNTKSEKGLCSMEIEPEVNPGDIALQKEQEKLLCNQLSNDAMAQTSPNGYSGTSKVDHTVVSRPDKSISQNLSQQVTNNDNLDGRRNDKPGVRCHIEMESEGGGAELAKKITTLYTGQALQEKNIVSSCLKHVNLKASASELPNPSSPTNTFVQSILDRGAVNKCQKRPVKSCESYSRDFRNWLYGSVCTDMHLETMNCNNLNKKEKHSALEDSGNKMQTATAEDFHVPPTLGVSVSSNQQVSQHCTSDIVHSSAANLVDAQCSSIPDLNFLPSMIPDEGPVPSNQAVCQVAVDDLKHQCATNSLSDSLTGPAIKEEHFEQAEPNHAIKKVCDKETSESANQLYISHLDTGPPKLSTVEGSSTSTDSFKVALCEFIKNILTPLCEDGLLTRQVYNIIVKKAVEKVAAVCGSNAPSTKTTICRVLSDEAPNLEKLVQGYLELYVGKEVLKKYA